MPADHDPGVLALVIDDPLAPRILAWWDVRKPTRALAVAGTPTTANEILSKAQLLELCRVVFASSEQVEATLERCDLARLIDYDGRGVTAIARTWLSSHVAAQLGLTRKKDRGGATVAIVALVAVAALVSLLLASPRGPELRDQLTVSA